MKSDIEIQVETSAICIKQEENLPNETAAQYFWFETFKLKRLFK